MSSNRRISKAFDDREFKYGEIYEAEDRLIDFPESRYTRPRTYHGVRSVVITYHCASNYDPQIWTLNAAPLSSQTHMKRDTDLEIEPLNGNYIDRKSLIRLGSAQPFLKVDLRGPVGKLTIDQLKQLTALQIKLAGVL